MNPLASPLLTDLYELTMLHAYFTHGMRETAVYEFFVRSLPSSRNFMLAAGLEQVLDFLEQLRFSPEELEWISKCGLFPGEFADQLEALRFTGDVHAMPEGTIVFPNEPSVRVTAPMPEAQLVESRLINLIHFETLVATKAARSVLIAPGKSLVDSGCAVPMALKPDCSRRGQVTLPVFPARPRCSRQRASVSRCSAPWRIHSCRHTTTKVPRSGASPKRTRGAPCYL